MTIGIYCLKFKGTYKVYVGQSVNIELRYKAHIHNLTHGISNYKLVEACKLYGFPILEILCECSIKELDKTEDEAIEIFDSVNNGFNIFSSSGSHFTGEDHGNSKHTNEQIIDAFNLLVDHPEKYFKDISSLTGVSIRVLETISSLTNHKWLEETFPEKYKVLISLKGNKTSCSKNNIHAKFSSEQIVCVFNLLVDNINISFKEVEKITGVSYAVICKISSLSNHSWLEKEFPERYLILRSLKGMRRKKI